MLHRIPMLPLLGVLLVAFGVFLPLLDVLLVASDVSQTQTPDAKTVRKAINDACMKTEGLKDAVSNVEDLVVVAEGRNIPVRLYRPKGDGQFPLLVFFHGGGWVAGNLETHDNACRYLCNRTPCCVLAVDYRLCPEHKFPAPLDDCYEATTWAVKNVAKLGGYSPRVAVIGDSAGGNMAAAVCLMARDRKGPAIRCQILVNPALDFTRWDKKDFPFRLFREFYLSDDKDATNPLASPLRAQDLRGLPPAFVITGEKDPLRDEGEDYVKKLRQAGVSANGYRMQGATHLGPLWTQAAPASLEALDLPIGVLRAAFRSGK
jgi:acetyl esterase